MYCCSDKSRRYSGDPIPGDRHPLTPAPPAPALLCRQHLRRWQAVTHARPLLTLLAPGHGAPRRIGYLLGLQALAAALAAMQRNQIAGGPFMAFAASLPFTPRERRRVDLAVLLLAHSPLLLVAASACGLAAGRGAPPAHAVLLCDVVLLAARRDRSVVFMSTHDRAFADAVGAAVVEFEALAPR